MWARSRRAATEAEKSAPEYVPPTEPLRVAVLTMARDEGDLLRRWVDHHADLVGRDGIIVLDDHSSDGSTEDLECTVHHLPALTGGGFERTRNRLLSGIASGLLHAYDYVIALDADEFLVVDPAVGGLGDLIEARGYPAVMGAVGLNLVQVPGEAPLDLGVGILEQRSFAVFAPVMCKPVLKRIDAAWVQASHGIRAPYAVDPALYLVHLKFADRDRLSRMATLRNDVFLADGRARKSSWSSPATDLLAAFDEAMRSVDPGAVDEFDPERAELEDAVTAEEGYWRAPRQGQLAALRDRPVVRVPARLRGLC